MAKKDPYKNIQKRFVQARAGDVEYEDLTVEQREQYQNRFNMLSQTVEGRTKIAQRLLPTATPDQRAQLKQRIRQNLPQGGGAGKEIDMPGEEPTPTRFERPAPTSANIRDMQAGFRMQGQAIEASRKAAAPTSPAKETTTKSKVSSSDRIGKGFFSVPKNPLSAIKEFATGAKDLVTGTADIVNRGYINPVINIAGRGADIVGGRTGSQKFKPLPQLSNKEIAIEAALTVGTAGIGKVASPLIRPTGAALSSAAKALGGRAPGVGAALGNISQRQANLAAVRQASALAQAGKQAVSERVAALGTDIGTGTTPKPSGAKFSTPKRGSSVARPTTPKPVTQKAVTPKPVVQKAVTQKAVKQKAVTPKNVSKVSGRKYPKSVKSTQDKQKFDEIYEQMSEEGYFDQGHGGLNAIFDPRKADDVAKRSKLTDNEIAKINKDAERMRAESVMREMQAQKDTDNILEKLNKPPTRDEIETATENYAPGFNEVFGDIEMPGTDQAYDEFVRSADEALSNILPKPAKPLPKSKRPKLIDKEAKTEEWVRKGGKIKPIKVQEIKTPKAPKKPKGQKKNQVVSPAPQTVDEPFDALDLQLAKDYPYSSAARRVYAAQRSKPIVQPTGQMAIEPRVSTAQPKIEESLSDKLLAAFKAEPRKQTGPDFTPRKVTKLPKVEPYSGQKVTGDQADSILFRAFDKGKRPKRTGGDYAIGQPMDVDIGTSPRLFPETNIPAGTQKDLQKEIQETIGIPEANIRQGRAINVRSRRKTKGKPGDMEMPTAKSLAAEGEPRTVPTEIPSTEVGLSFEQRQARFYREMFPQARSARQARKMYEESMGRQDIITTIEEFGPIGNPLENAPKSPITTTEVQRPIKFEKTINAKGEVINKPVAFKTETVPAMWTTSSGKKPTPLEDVVEMQYPRVDAAKAEAGRKARKSEKLSSQARQAARLRNRGVVGDQARSKADEVVRAQKEGKQFQKGNEIELARELNAFYENYMKEGFEQKRFRPALPEKPKTPKTKRNKKK